MEVQENVFWRFNEKKEFQWNFSNAVNVCEFLESDIPDFLLFWKKNGPEKLKCIVLHLRSSPTSVIFRLEDLTKNDLTTPISVLTIRRNVLIAKLTVLKRKSGCLSSKDPYIFWSISISLSLSLHQIHLFFSFSFPSHQEQ